MEAEYNPVLVALSFIVSVLGSYTALQLAVAIPQASDGVEKRNAIIKAGVAMGGGAIWTMHFIAMLAYDMGMSVTYDVFLTVLSAVVAMAACSVGLAVAGIGLFTFDKLLPAGIFMGCGVAGMHYMGMAAMLMPMEVSYNLNILILSVIIGVLASCAALWMAFHMRGKLQVLGSSILMGAAVCGMHYTGMAAARYEHTNVVPESWFAGALGGEYLGISIFAVTVSLLLLTLAIGSHRRRQREELAI
ncbi:MULTISPECIES: MHYT domain-containing protein [Microbulbifer]|uniref:MHYT domain-containing protein n=1 Tax=Microbulbifer celer TaxID=435905 RepID=A0ABW3U4R9_9GAMM|nr:MULTISPECIES: MHYT domain-containing protein [Microbulbifer]UFN57899.1 hypothetical protein LPW13_02300 [Microbulbifer celer]